MITGISIVSVWVLDQDAAKEFYTEKLGFRLTNDVKLEGGMRWLTVRPPGSDKQDFLLMDPLHSMLDEESAQQVRALVAKGALSPGVMATTDCQGDHAVLAERGVEFTQEPAERPYGVEAISKQTSTPSAQPYTSASSWRGPPSGPTAPGRPPSRARGDGGAGTVPVRDKDLPEPDKGSAACGARAAALLYSLVMADSEPGGEVARSELRASHDDRDRVVEMLRVSAGDGRLTAEELDERLELAMTARTYGELAQLVADLPAEGSAVSPAAAPKAKDVVRIDTRSGHVKRVDRWVVPQRMEVKVTSGHVTLDFTQAVITQPTLKLDVDVRSGNLSLVTMPGIVVDADEVAIRSGGVRVKAPWGPDVPARLRIEVTGKVGSGHFVARPRYRTFWQWLTRQPKPYMVTAR